MNLKPLKKILRILNPRTQVGGLEINDMSVGFMSLDPETKRIIQASIPLPLGALRNGKVTDQKAFVDALKKLRSQVPYHNAKQVPVIVSISDENVYTQIFSLPALKGGGFEEAVALNLQTISPIEFSKTYAGWIDVPSEPQGITQEAEVELNESEIVASFIPKEIVDTITHALEEAHFSVVAMEQKAASFTRSLATEEVGFLPDASYFGLYANSDGISFSVIHKGILRFNRFSSWQSLQASDAVTGGISPENFKNFVTREMHQINNFYISRFKVPLRGVYIVAPGMEQVLRDIILKDFSLTAIMPTFRNITLPPAWIIPLGAALRGIIPRLEDTQISLTPEGTRQHFVHEEVISFIGLWRNVAAAIFFIILISYVGVFLFLSSYTKTVLADSNNVVTSTSGIERLRMLTQAANDFNANVTRALTLKAGQVPWSQMLSAIYSKAGSAVIIDRLYIQSLQSGVVLSGRATTNAAALDFKNSLETIPYIQNVQLPVSGIAQADQNTITFNISFNIKQQ